MAGDIAWLATAVPREGTTKATRAISQTRERVRVMSAAPTIQHFEQFVDLGPAVVLGAGVKGMRHAMLQVVAQRRLFDLVEGGTDGADLRQHVDAVALLLDHARHTAHLAFDAAEARELGFLEFLIHGLNYTPVGYT